jgi:hypothetical protein
MVKVHSDMRGIARRDQVEALAKAG